MPRYDYVCGECEEISTIRHSISEPASICPKCEAENSLKKIFNMPQVVTKNNAGNVVKAHIENARDEIKKEKREMIERDVK